MKRSPRKFWRSCDELSALVVVVTAAIALMLYAALSPNEMLAITDAMLEGR